MKSKFFTLALLVCCMCVLPSYADKCTPVCVDMVTAAVPVEELCPETGLQNVSRNTQPLEVYPLSLMAVEL